MLDFARGDAALSMTVPGRSFPMLEIKVANYKAMTNDTGPVRAEGQIVTFGRRAFFDLALPELLQFRLRQRFYAAVDACVSSTAALFLAFLPKQLLSKICKD